MNVILIEGTVKGYHECPFTVRTGESLVLQLLREHFPVSRLSTNETFRQEMVFMTRFQSSSSYFLKSLEEKQELKCGSLFTKGRI